MMDSGNEPVEISMHFSPEDWTETSLPGLVRSYQDKIHAMGAPTEDIVTQVNKPADGSVDVHVRWDRRGTVMNPMTGKDERARPARDRNTSELVMFTDEQGETYVERQD